MPLFATDWPMLTSMSMPGRDNNDTVTFLNRIVTARQSCTLLTVGRRRNIPLPVENDRYRAGLMLAASACVDGFLHHIHGHFSALHDIRFCNNIRARSPAGES